jgi:hypothetical protein
MQPNIRDHFALMSGKLRTVVAYDADAFFLTDFHAQKVVARYVSGPSLRSA